MDAFCRYKHRRSSSRTYIKSNISVDEFCGPPNVNSPPFWFVSDFLGIFCCFLTWIIILSAFLTFTFIIWPLLFGPHLLLTNNIIYTAIYVILACLTFFSHKKTVFSDPGSVPRIVENEREEDVYEFSHLMCSLCSSLKPARAHHCSVCMRCIRKMDHHCPWVNNCVGEANQKYFLLFLFYVFSFSVYSVILSTCALRSLTKLNSIQGFMVSGTTAAVLCILLWVEGVLFGVFSISMFCTQLYGLATDKTGIERLKGDRVIWTPKNLSFCRNFQETLSRDAPLYWGLCPFDFPYFLRPSKPLVYYL